MTECFSVVVFSRVKQNCLIVILRRGLEIATDTVTDATNIFSLATKNYGFQTIKSDGLNCTMSCVIYIKETGD